MISSPRLRHIGALACSVALVALVSIPTACTVSSVPTAPTGQAVPRIPVVQCPANVTSQSFNGLAVPIVFAAEVSGVQPLTLTCTPTSGTSFSIGATTVSCTVSDAAQHQSSCSFSVRVFGPPRISATKFLAFGDSLTAGMVPPAPVDSYPSRLQRKLAARYITQTIALTNDGLPAEVASPRGLTRLPLALNAFTPEVLLLMEGTNDLADGNEGAAAALDALTSMIRIARGRGIRVFLATIPPDLRPSGFFVPGFNDGIRTVAQREGATLVDVYAAMAGDPSLIGPDGLHPTQQGLEVMAQTFYDVIQPSMELPPQ